MDEKKTKVEMTEETQEKVSGGFKPPVKPGGNQPIHVEPHNIWEVIPTSGPPAPNYHVDPDMTKESIERLIHQTGKHIEIIGEDK